MDADLLEPDAFGGSLILSFSFGLASNMSPSGAGAETNAPVPDDSALVELARELAASVLDDNVSLSGVSLRCFWRSGLPGGVVSTALAEFGPSAGDMGSVGGCCVDVGAALSDGSASAPPSSSSSESSGRSWSRNERISSAYDASCSGVMLREARARVRGLPVADHEPWVKNCAINTIAKYLPISLSIVSPSMTADP